MGTALLKEKPLLGQKIAQPRLSARERAASRWFSREKHAVESNFASGRIVYNYYRYYDPSLGRYITSDPIGLRSGPNTYLYALANPIRYIDPYGLFGLNNDEMQTLIDAVNGDPKAIDKMGELEDAQRDAVVEAMEDVKEGAEVVKDDPRLRPIPKGVGSAVRRVKDFWEDLRDFFGDDRKDPDDCPQ
jgi:RHS repeat-associated protein